MSWLTEKQKPQLPGWPPIQKSSWPVGTVEETMLLLRRQALPRRWSRADRFHMLKNLGEALEGCLARHLAIQRKTHTQKTLEEHLPIGETPRPIRRSPKVDRLHQAYREERLARYEQ